MRLGTSAPARLGCALTLLGLFAVSCTAGPVKGPNIGSPTPVSPPSGPVITPEAVPSQRPAVVPSPSELAVSKPPIVRKPIPFPDVRKAEMAAYARRHYALDTYRLERPQAIVEHYTAASPFSAVWNGFASNTPDLGELPGTCSHFVIDTDGTIYQLVPLGIMCRHTSGMNFTAFGIEMVAFSDQEIIDRPRQLNAALSLTLWLMSKFGIELRNVIGHNENLMSPLRKELVASFRCQTHADWNHTDMELFRSKLASLAKRYGVPLGPPSRWVDSGC